MPSVQYGNRIIDYIFEPRGELKSHYITVQRSSGVILKGSPVGAEKERKLILKKARWILDKLQLVSAIGHDDIVTGSRVQYLGRKYYVEVFLNSNIKAIDIEFTESKFKVYVPTGMNNQEMLQNTFEIFIKQKAIEKIVPRIKKWSKKTGLEFNEIKFRKLETRWGSCSPGNNILINTDAVKLPYSLIDYLIVHELVHTKIKNHTKEFWAEVSKHMPRWKDLDKQMYGMKL